MKAKVKQGVRTVTLTLRFNSEYQYDSLFYSLRALESKGQLCPYLQALLRELDRADKEETQ